MSYSYFIIGNFRQGLVNYYRPWLLADDAFVDMQDANIFRGNVVKRTGYTRLDSDDPTSLPAGPVMGLWKRDRAGLAAEDLIAFNLTKAFIFNTATQVFDDISGATLWTGTDSDFFWATNAFGSFWATNFVDAIRYYISGTTWTNFTPTVNGATTLQRAMLLFPYRGRLVALSTVEGGVSFPQRARWSALGSPYVGAPVPAGFGSSANAWRDDIAGNGGFIDAPTNDSIVSATFNKDTLIVQMQSSTWRLIYTGIVDTPFVWEAIDTNLGSECTFSAVDFDEGGVAISRRGIVISDSSTVKRIDEKIPDFVQSIEVGDNGLKRVQGIRDLDRQFAYWAYGDFQSQPETPNRVLAYNYVESSWSLWNVNFTTFGKFRQTQDITWALVPATWSDYTVQWNNGIAQIGTELTVAGDSDGNVFYLSDTQQDDASNFGFDIRTKQFNPFFPNAEKCRMKYVDLYLRGDPDLAFTMEVYTDDQTDFPTVTKTVSAASAANSTYVRIYTNTVGRFQQLRFYLSADQLADDDIAQSDFCLQALGLHMAPAGRPFNP